MRERSNMGTYANGVVQKGYSGEPSIKYVKNWYATSPNADKAILPKYFDNREIVSCYKSSDVLKSMLTEEALKELSDNNLTPESVVFSFVATLTDKDENSYEGCHVEYVYNPSTEFTNLYGTSFRHDGTLLFEIEGLREAFHDMLDFAPAFPGKWEFAKNPDGKKILVEYGDFIILNLSEDGPEGKKWMSQRTIINLPMRFSIVNNRERRSDP